MDAEENECEFEQISLSEGDLDNVAQGYVDNCSVDIGHFDLLEKLGEGAYGIVFLVRKNRGIDKGSYYALKVIIKAEVVKLPGTIADMRAERKLLELLRHCAYIQKLYYAFQTDDRLFLVTEYLSGGDLFSLSARQQLPESDVIFYLAELTVPLEYIHLHGIVYRDIKLENVLLDAEGHVKLVDFGLCKKLGVRGRTNTFCGTVEYMAPEVVACTGHNTAADWWALGVLAIELLSSTTPFGVNDELYQSDDQDKINQAKMQRITNGDPTIPDNISANMKDFLLKMLNKDPTERLGGSDASAKQIRDHPLFSGIDWESLKNKQLPAPFVPKLRSPTDTRNFDVKFTFEPSEVPTDSFSIFKGYSYIAPELHGTEENCIEMDGYNDTSIVENTLTEEILSNHDPDSKFHQKYKFTSNEPLGIGATSVCMRCCDLAEPKTEFVVKIYKHEHKNETEIEFLRKAKTSPGVPHLHEVVTDKKLTYLIMELIDGMDLLQYIAKKRSSKVERIAETFHELWNVIDSVHSLQCTHGRVCFKSIRLMKSGKVRLLGFTSAKPIRTEADKRIDYWSLGVCLYTVLCGHSPFNLLENDVTDRIIRNDFDQQSPQWKALSSDARNVVENLLRGSSEDLNPSKWKNIKCPAVNWSKEMIDENQKIVDIRAALKIVIKTEVLTNGNAHRFDESKVEQIELNETVKHSEPSRQTSRAQNGPTERRRGRKAKVLLKPEEIKKEAPMTLRIRPPPAKEASTSLLAKESKKRGRPAKLQQIEATTIREEPPCKMLKLDPIPHSRVTKKRGRPVKSQQPATEIIPALIPAVIAIAREPLNAARISKPSSSSQSTSQSHNTIHRCIHSSTNCRCFGGPRKSSLDVFYTFERFDYK